MIFIILIIIFIIFFIYIKRTLKNKREVITCYTGTLGSGKSLFSVQDTISLYYSQRRKYIKYKLLGKLGLKKYKEYIPLPLPDCFTTIPVLINKRKNIYSKQLTLKHLLLQESIPEGSVLFIDEIGNFASQFDFKNPNVLKAFNEFIRFFRHYVNGYIICNEQSSNFIELHIRNRINTIHNLSNCFVFWRLCFYYDRQINIAEENITTVDMKNEATNSDTQDNKSLKIRFLKYKNRYKSRCYKNRYKLLDKDTSQRFTSSYSNSLLRCPTDKVYIPKTERKELK